MREDMFKVIVERPRRVNSNAYKGDGRLFRNQEDGPSRLGMKRGYDDRKPLNENLAPLKRYLEKQVNRPWDKVHSEIRAAIDARSTVKQHVLQHLDDFVAIQARWEEDGKGGHVTVRRGHWTNGHVRLEESSTELFVHPLTGILLRNRRYTSWQEGKKQERRAAEQEKLAVRRDVSARVQLHRIDGVWYEVVLDELPAAREVTSEMNGTVKKEIVQDSRWDVMRKAWVARESAQRLAPPGSNQDFYGRAELYARSKRQLGSRELKRYRLTDSHQKQKALSGPFAFGGMVCAAIETPSATSNTASPAAVSASRGIGSFHRGVKLRRITPLFARAVARSLAAAEGNVIVDPGRRRIDHDHTGLGLALELRGVFE
jgi:hypothetical protein